MVVQRGGSSEMSAEGKEPAELLQIFSASNTDKLVITDTTAVQRSAVHEWIESHADPEVKAWGHVSETRGTQRVLLISREQIRASGGAQETAAETASAAEDVPRPTKRQRQQMEKEERAEAQQRGIPPLQDWQFTPELQWESRG